MFRGRVDGFWRSKAMIKKLQLFYFMMFSRLDNANMNSIIAVFMVFITGVFLFVIWFLPVSLKIIGIIVSIIYCCVIIYCYSFVRVSNSMIYSKLTRKAYMSIKDLTGYRNLDYIKERKDKVAVMVEQEFTDGIVEVDRISKGKPIHFKTHKWILEKVLKSDKVAELYQIENLEEIKFKKNIRAHNILLLMTWDYIYGHWNNTEFVKEILKPRECCKITLESRNVK